MDCTTRERIEDALGVRVGHARALTGGCVAPIWRVSLDDGSDVVVKQGEGLGVEARSLELLREGGGLPTPRIRWRSEELLVMSWVESGGGPDARGVIEAAEALARMHMIGAGSGAPYGLEFDTRIGGLVQPNGPMPSWPTFYGERRLVAMAHDAASAGRFGLKLVREIETLSGVLGEWLPERPMASLLHGDVWSGNVLWREGRLSAFIDPAPYRGDPEVELAFITLLGTFGRDFFEAYGRLNPIDPAFWGVRREVYTLYPLLVHARLFGGTYTRQVESTVHRLSRGSA